MPGPEAPSAPSLQLLLRNLTVARRRVEQERTVVAFRQVDAAEGRVQLLTALQRYAAAITASGRPLPYRLRNEIVLCRALCPATIPIR